MTLTLDKMGRVVVPKKLRERFSLEPGDELEVAVEADGIKIRPFRRVHAIAEENGLLVCISELPASSWDVPAFIEEQRSQRSRTIGGI